MIPATSSPTGERPVFALTPFTLLDYPEKTACIVWLCGCNMRCAYCHNPQIALSGGRGTLTAESVLDFLQKRQGLLDAVVFSGGEATAWPGLPALLRQVRALGFLIKVDTNGLRPAVLKALLAEGLIDRLALDYKAPEAKFKEVTGVTGFSRFAESLHLLCTQTTVPFEVRTTVHTDLMGEDDLNTIMADLAGLGYRGLYAVQNFRADNDRPTLKNLPPQTREINPALLNVPSTLTLELRNFSATRAA